MSEPAPAVIPLSQITPAPVRWLWQPYLPRGKLVILDGDPGVGKSLVAVDLAARLSRGGPMPDGTPSGRPHTAFLLSSGEDGAEDTLRPRAEVAGADLDRLVVYPAWAGPPRSPADFGRFEGILRLHAADLVVIDPMTAFLPPEAASNPRGALGLLSGVAARTDCTILLIRHLRKKEGRAIHRGLGSVGIIGVVRVGLLLADHPATPGLRVLTVTKSNLARTPPTLGLRIRGDDAGRAAVEWAGPLDVPADVLGLPAARPVRPRDRAGDWLLAQLAGGPRRVKELLAAAAEAGIPEKTLNRAKAEVRVKAKQACVGGGKDRGEGVSVWYWYDPDVPWPADAPFPSPDLEELPPLW